MSRYIQTAAAFTVFWLVAWSAGFDFDERSPGVALWLVISIGAAIFIWTMPRENQ